MKVATGTQIELSAVTHNLQEVEYTIQVDPHGLTIDIPGNPPFIIDLYYDDPIAVFCNQHGDTIDVSRIKMHTHKPSP